MPTSTSDVEWFSKWLKNFESYNAKIITRKCKTACVSLIFRFNLNENTTITPEQNERILNSQLNDLASVIELFQYIKNEPALSTSPIELLYMKRAYNEKDPWSGQISFPGGKQEPSDSSDMETAIRETHEEVHLDLGDKSKFAYIGRLKDKQVIPNLKVVPFIFFQLVKKTPELQLQSSEVSHVFWVPISFFLSFPKRYLHEYVWTVDKDITPFPSGYFGVDQLYFSSILLPHFRNVDDNVYYNSNAENTSTDNNKIHNSNKENNDNNNDNIRNKEIENNNNNNKNDNNNNNEEISDSEKNTNNENNLELYGEENKRITCTVPPNWSEKDHELWGLTLRITRNFFTIGEPRILPDHISIHKLHTNFFTKNGAIDSMTKFILMISSFSTTTRSGLFYFYYQLKSRL